MATAILPMERSRLGTPARGVVVGSNGTGR